MKRTFQPSNLKSAHMASELEWLPPVAEQFLIEGEQKEEKGFLRNFCQTLFQQKQTVY